MTYWIWGLSLAAYLLFLSWYFNWDGPVDDAEVEDYVALFETGGKTTPDEVETLRRFLQDDDGREFVMQNLVKYFPTDVTHPSTGQLARPQRIVEDYFRPFSVALLKRGGHPVIASQRVGGNVDSWGTEDATLWDVSALMRYRSRRDLVELATHPDFADMHLFKLAAIAQTQSYPTQTSVSVYLGPKFTVPLFLLLIASLLTNLRRLFR